MTHPYIPTRANEPHNRIWFETRPRHLAGRGDPRRITQTLRAAGWKNHSDADYPHVVLASPDYRHTVVLEPEPESYGAWWRIRGESEGHSWYTEFGANAPVEILAALTDALLEPEPEPETTPDIWQALTSAGWTYERDEHGNETAMHPDGTLSLRRWTVAPAERFFWTAEATLSGGGGGRDLLWRASLDDAMPRHLIAAFTTALASDEPVQRGMCDVPHSYLVTQEQRGPQGEQLAVAHEAHLKAVRAAARKARRTAALPTSSGPAPTAAPSAPVRNR
ncbi:DUF317 domain-containing protein [Streptomyces silvisoli]|uniref:DUF317 domain-containing protein n=1 Tax=Streptomyces silvisoli TaxID=3034235 RepID=A0ABT5ZRE9_9ACTN|nr:DUF317 domain-containing protein [Streptomyces silvisoli]MDF3292398.1 DUF317 domain-containing protein [Streptomyces silvisoli]